MHFVLYHTDKFLKFLLKNKWMLLDFFNMSGNYFHKFEPEILILNLKISNLP